MKCKWFNFSRAIEVRWNLSTLANPRAVHLLFKVHTCDCGCQRYSPDKELNGEVSYRCPRNNVTVIRRPQFDTTPITGGQIAFSDGRILQTDFRPHDDVKPISFRNNGKHVNYKLPY